MKLPRDISGERLAKALKACGYQIARQEGSHIRLTTNENGKHHVTVPNHSPLRVGTFAAILDDVAAHAKISRDDLLGKLKL